MIDRHIDKVFYMFGLILAQHLVLYIRNIEPVLLYTLMAGDIDTLWETREKITWDLHLASNKSSKHLYEALSTYPSHKHLRLDGGV